MYKKFKHLAAFLSCLTIFKLVNACKLFISFHLSSIISRPIHWGQIMTLSFEPGTSCNLRCPECPSGLRSFTRERGMLDPRFFKKTLDQIYPSLISMNFYFQGEPFLNPDLLDMVAYTKSKQVYTLISTNAHYLNESNCLKIIESGLNELIISIDGTTQETYSSYRIGGDMNKVIEGTRRIISLRNTVGASTPKIIFQFLVVKPNEQEIPSIQKLAKELEVDELRLKTAQIYDYKNGNPLIPEQEKYSRYIKRSDGSYTIKNKLSNKCWKMWQSAVISWDGLVLPCCFDKDAQYRLGDLKHNSFQDIWESQQYNKMRSAILNYRNKIDICQNCTEGCSVWA